MNSKFYLFNLINAGTRRNPLAPNGSENKTTTNYSWAATKRFSARGRAGARGTSFIKNGDSFYGKRVRCWKFSLNFAPTLPRCRCIHLDGRPLNANFYTSHLGRNSPFFMRFLNYYDTLLHPRPAHCSRRISAWKTWISGGKKLF